MKKTLFLLFNLLIISKLAFAQSVTLATSIPVSPTKGTVVYNNGTNQLQYWNGTAWIPITNAASGTGWALNGTDIYNSNSGRVLIGASSLASSFKFNVVTPPSSFGILHSGTNNINIGSYVGGANGFFGTTSNHPFFLMANFGSQMVILPNGNIGIGVSTPTNKLQIGSVTNAFVGNDLAIGNGVNTMSIYQSSASTLIASTTDIVLKPRNNNAGYVGINVDSPTNRLQIGSMGGTGYAGNDIAIGNGTNVTGLYQSSASFSIASTTSIVLRPNNGNGLVGINTTSPRAPLDVATAANVNSLSDFFTSINVLAYGLNNLGFVQYNSPRPNSYVPGVSIVAEGSVYAETFDVYSDSRIKNIKGISNSAKDLETIMAIQITDYTMKDRVQYGNKPFKKVIAQQVEKVYPQAVSQIKDVVPDIYTLAEKVVFDEVNKNLICLLSRFYDIKVGEKIEFVHKKEGKIKAEVVGVSGNSFTVKDWQYPTDKIFVYGREVNDFRSVDYEAISMLGISAIQQLAKENEDLKSRFTTENDVLKKQISDLYARFERFEAMIIKETKTTEKLNN